MAERVRRDVENLRRPKNGRTLAAPADSNPTTPDGRAPHVLVCVKGQPFDLRLMQRAQSLAQWLAARLTVVYAFRLGAARNLRVAIDRDRNYARSIGASLVELPAYSPEQAIAEYGHARGVTHVVLAEDRTGALTDLLASALLNRITDVNVYYVPAGEPV
jgi:K+-sensing histidine kinase KdpD